MTATADIDALLAAVRAAPDDDAPRLIAADAYDEAGEHERAEFIRVQVELARRDVSPSACMLRAREKELWGYLPARDAVRGQFSRDMPGFAVLLSGDVGNGLTHRYPWVTVRRGFPDALTITAADLVWHREALAPWPWTRCALSDVTFRYEARGLAGWEWAWPQGVRPFVDPKRSIGYRTEQECRDALSRELVDYLRG